MKKEKGGYDKVIGYYNEGDVFGDACLYSKCQADQSIMSLVPYWIFRRMENYMLLKELVLKEFWARLLK